MNASSLPHPFSVIPGNPIIAILPPSKGKVRTRKVVKRSNARATGKYFSWKVQRMIQWESIHELHAFHMLDADLTVQSFGEQPMTIEYRIGDVETYHVPDILVCTKMGWEVWEVKPANDAKDEDVLARTKLMGQSLPAHGYRYRMIIGEDLAREPRHSTIKTLLKYGREDIGAIERETLRRQLAALTTLTWGEVCLGMFGEKCRAHVCRLLLEGALGWNSEVPLLHDTPLELAPCAIKQPRNSEA